MLGITKGIILLALVNLAGGIVIFLANPLLRPALKWSYSITVAAIGLISLIALTPGDRPLSLYSPFFGKIHLGDKILYYKEGLGATVTVHQLSPNPFDNTAYKIMEVDGVSVAGTSPALRTTQKFQGHIPLVLYKAFSGKDPAYVFILGLGTGESSHSITLHNIRKLDCLELVSAEIQANSHFSEINKNIMENPKFQLTIEDARNYLLTTRKTYDVIESDSVHPDIDINIYTKEYFNIAKSRLSEYGIFSTWIPLFNLSAENFKIMLKTFNEVFPHMAVWYTPTYRSKHALLIGTKRKLKIDFELLKEELGKDSIARSLAEVDLDSLYKILSSYIMDETVIKNYIKDSPVNTDNKTYLPYYIPKQTVGGEATVSGLLGILNSFGSSIYPHLQNIKDRDEVTRQLDKYLKARTHQIKATGHYYDRDYENQFYELKRALVITPEDNHLKHLSQEAQYYMFLKQGKEYSKTGALDKAALMFRNALTINESSAVARAGLGVIYYKMNQTHNAVEQFKKALEIAPYYVQPRYNLAHIYYVNGKYEDARIELEMILEINPEMKRASNLLEKLKENTP